MNVQADPVHDFTRDLLYASCRCCRDDWNVRSCTLDLNYRHPVEEAPRSSSRRRGSSSASSIELSPDPVE